MTDKSPHKQKYATHHQIAIVFGIEPRTATKWVNELGMPRAGRGQYDIVACVQWRENYNKKIIAELRAGGKDGLSARKDYFIASAEMKRYQIAEKKKKLVKISDVISVWIEFFTLLMSRKKTFAKNTNRKLEEIQSPGEREKILDESSNELFAGIYDRGLAKFRGLEELLETTERSADNPKAVAPHARKRVGKRTPHSKRRNGKRSRKV